MHCSDFLELYSDYRDGLLKDPAVIRRVYQHLRECSRCMNYDALVSRGVMTLRSIGEIKPSARLGPAMFHESQPVSRRSPMARGLPVAALVGALLSAGAMLLLQRQDVRVESGLVNGATETKVAQPLAEVAPARTAAADSAVPFVKTAPPTPLITVTDLVSPVGADATVESFAAWVTQSR